MNHVCCYCATRFDNSLPLCPMCGSAAIVQESRWDGLKSESATELIERLKQATQRQDKYRDALVDVGNCHNLATVRECVRRALA